MIILGQFFLFLHKTYVVGTHQKRLAEAFLMNTHNICCFVFIVCLC